MSEGNICTSPDGLHDYQYEAGPQAAHPLLSDNALMDRHVIPPRPEQCVHCGKRRIVY